MLKFRYSIKSVPILIGGMMLVLTLARAESNWQTLASFTIDRKPFDLLAIKNGAWFIDKPAVRTKEDVQRAIARLAKNTHRNTSFLLGESRYKPFFVVQPNNPFRDDEISKAKEVWATLKYYDKVYSADGFVFNFKGNTYQAVATYVNVDRTRYELMAFTSISRAIGEAYEESLHQLIISVLIITLITLVILFSVSQAAIGNAAAIRKGEESRIGWWWPDEIRQAAIAYNAFRESEAIYKIQIDQSTTGQLTVVPNSRGNSTIQSCNTALATISGWKTHQLIGYPLNKIVPEKYHAFHYGAGVFDTELNRHVGTNAYAKGCPFSKAAESRIVGKERTVELLHRDGHTLRVILGVRYLGKEKWAGAITNVDDLVKAQEKAEKLAEETENINHITQHDVKGDIVASIKAAEFVEETIKETLDYLENAEEEVKDNLEFAIKFSRRIVDSQQNAFNIIDQRNKLRSFKEKIEEKPCLTDDICNAIEASFDATQGDLYMDNGATGLSIYADMPFFLAAVKNLIRNAFIHNESLHKKVWIKIYPKDDMILFSVLDNGIGMSTDYLKSWGKVQGKMAQVTPGRGGSGIGLYSVRQTIEAHKAAKIEVFSELGKGTEFLLSMRAA